MNSIDDIYYKSDKTLENIMTLLKDCDEIATKQILPMLHEDKEKLENINKNISDINLDISKSNGIINKIKNNETLSNIIAGVSTGIAIIASIVLLRF